MVIHRRIWWSSCLSKVAFSVVALFGSVSAVGEVRIPLTVRSFREQPSPFLPVWTGVPLPRSAVKDAGSLRLLGPDGKPVPAQFDVQARWADKSINWVLVSFQAARPVTRRGRPTWTQIGFTLIDDASVEAPQPGSLVRVRPDTNDTSIVTGPLRVLLNRQGFRGISQACLDMNGNDRFENAELISQEAGGSGIVAMDAQGRAFTSAAGRVRRIEVERDGPVHAVVAVYGDLRAAGSGLAAEDLDRGTLETAGARPTTRSPSALGLRTILPTSEPLLNYSMRVHAFAGSSLLRVVLTVHNPRPTARAEDGSRWVLGQSGSVLLRSLEYVQPVQFAEGLRRVTLATEAGTIFDRIPLTGPMSVYQDSSGGENWFHRTHVDKDNLIPLTFRGYRAYYGGRAIHQGLRASPWVDVADTQWAVSLAAPAFWQNFPKALAVDADGTIRLGLWPKRRVPGNTASRSEALLTGTHEIQGGEQKTHEFWLYFRHRRRTADQPGLMPLARELMPTCLVRPMVWAAAEAYARADVTDPIAPMAKGQFAGYEAIVAAAVRDTRNLLTQREEVDEYGWRNFGDTWAANESTRTSGPYHGLRPVSHYNNEYDLGFGMLEQAMRTVDADPDLARDWWQLGMEALWHEADIDIYHTRSDPAPVYNGGMFTHTAHGVEAGRSTHRGSPRDELWGALDWPWKRGSTPESGHFRNRGILIAYLLTGDGHLLDAANDIRDLVVFKVKNDRFAQINTPNRDAGNNMQILLDAYLLSRDAKYLQLCDKCAAAASFDAVTKRTGRAVSGGDAWQYGLFLKSLGRLIEIKAEMGLRDQEAIDSYLKYARGIHERFYARRGQRWRGGSWSLLTCEVMMRAAELTTDATERKNFIEAAEAAFRGLDYLVREDGTGRFYNSKATTMYLQGGGRYMRWALKNAPTTRAAAGSSPTGRPPRAGRPN